MAEETGEEMKHTSDSLEEDVTSGEVIIPISSGDTVSTGSPIDLQYFAVQENTIDEAVAMVKKMLSANDSNLKGCWLLTEIDHWDFEQERLVLLSENSVISCSFNFRFKYIKEWKVVPLELISEVVYGQPVYPSYAVVWSSERKKTVRLNLKGEEAGFFQRWNPFHATMPFAMFESHILDRRGLVTDNPRLQVDTFVQALGEALQAADLDVSITENPVHLATYVNVWGMIYNQSRMGFHKTRGFGTWELR